MSPLAVSARSLIPTALALSAALLAVAAAAPARSADEVPLSARSRVQVVYFSAADCPFCRRFESPEGGRAAFLASPAAREIEFYEAPRASLTQPPSVKHVPAPAKWIWDKAFVPRSTPAWVVAVDETVVMSVSGLDHWEGSVRPLVERLVERRRQLRR